jgi:hypothetical protein
MVGKALTMKCKSGRIGLPWISLGLAAAFASAAGAAEVKVTKSYAACKNTPTVQKFEDFERRNDDQGYKQLYLQTGTSGECIFLRAGEILNSGETQGRWICVRESPGAACYWTAASAVQAR